jgi:hypothetical protein
MEYNDDVSTSTSSESTGSTTTDASNTTDTSTTGASNNNKGGGIVETISTATGLSAGHLIIIVAGYIVMVFICVCLINTRYLKRKRILKHIPRTIMPFRVGDISAVRTDCQLDRYTIYH